MPEARAPIEDLMVLAFEPRNVNAVMAIMQNPVRQITELQFKAVESLAWSLLAVEGDASKLPIAAGAFMAERIEDPIRVVKIIMTNGIQRGGIPDV